MEYASFAFSIVAMIISGYGVYESRKNNRIGQAPMLVGHEYEGPNEYSYSIKNKGNGPALFEKVEYFRDMEPLSDLPLRDAVREVLASKGIRAQMTITQFSQKGVMAAGEEVSVGKIIFPADDSAKFRAIDDVRLGIRITYRSSHGKKLLWASRDELLE